MSDNTLPNDLIVLADAHQPSLIKVIGVGGGGGNAVGQMYREHIEGVRFLVCNTDKKALDDSVVPDHLQLGPGLGAGGKPEIGQKYAEEHVEDIRKALDPETKMVFITAGMGGGTGTGASPVVAREARRKGILTIGVVTLPFLFERERQIDKALDGLEALAKEVDAILVINNQRLCDIYPSLNVIDAFRKADETLTVAVRSIVEIIVSHGIVGLDFRDVHNVLKDGGVAIMSTGYGEGDGRVTKAIQEALHSPLLNNNDIYRARRIILSVTTADESCPEHVLRMEEMGEINDFTDSFADGLETKWGLCKDPDIKNRVKITILASGFGLYQSRRRDASPTIELSPIDSEEEERRRLLREEFYRPPSHPEHKRRYRPRPRIFRFGIDDLDNEELIALVDSIPTRSRTIDQLHEMRHIAESAQTERKGTQENSDSPFVIDF